MSKYLFLLALLLLPSLAAVQYVTVHYDDGTAQDFFPTHPPVPPTTKPVPNIKVVPPSADVIASGLKSGDVVEFQAGVFADTKTINLPSNTILRGVATTMPAVSITSLQAYGTDFAAIHEMAANVEVDNLAIQCVGNKIASAVKISGVDCTVTNIHQFGVGAILDFSGAQRLHADMLDGSDGTSKEYVIKAFGAGADKPSVDCRIDRFNAKNTQGVHVFRVEHPLRLTIGHPTLRWPGTDFSWIGEYANPAFGGCVIALNHSTDCTIQYGQAKGIVGVGPIHIWAAPHPDWRDTNPYIHHCDIKTLVLNLGVVNAKVEDCHIGFLRLDGEKQTTPTYPPGSGTFTRCTFDTKPVVVGDYTFDQCWANNVPLGNHGE